VGGEGGRRGTNARVPLRPPAKKACGATRSRLAIEKVRHSDPDGVLLGSASGIPRSPHGGSLGMTLLVGNERLRRPRPTGLTCRRPGRTDKRGPLARPTIHAILRDLEPTTRSQRLMDTSCRSHIPVGMG